MSALTVLLHRFRINLFVAVLLIAPCAFAARELIAQARHGSDSNLILAWAFLMSIGLILWLIVDSSCTVTETELVIRGGPVRMRVPLASIRRVRRSHTLIAAPGLSLRRLEIDHGTGGLAVMSPRMRPSFPR